MFDFAFYTLHGEMMAAEAAGLHSFLRDESGKVGFFHRRNADAPEQSPAMHQSPAATTYRSRVQSHMAR